MILLGGAVAASLGWRLAIQREAQLLTQSCETRVAAERAAGHHLCFSTLEALAYAIEASEPLNVGHLDSVLRIVSALARVLDLPEEEADALRAAALLHNIGRLGVPEHILHKTEALTLEEQEKLRIHPVLGARILASIPFPWPVVPLVRHHAEHWDGSGYPDGLRGDAIPRGARILALANTYSALLRTHSLHEALEEIERRSGTQFDPALVAAFRPLAAQVQDDLHEKPPALATLAASAPEALPATPTDEARAALNDIAAAQRETIGLYTLAQSVSGSLHLGAVAQTLLECTRNIVPCSACVLFLPEDDAEFLQAHAALGTNERHLLGSLAGVGTHLTGRAFSRGEMIRAAFLPDDLILRDVSDPWTPFHATLIVPLTVGGQSIGTLNLYAEEPDAFGLDSRRVMRLVATQAGRAIDNARRFAAVQETAYTDAMTGLRNARFLREYLDREINRADRDSMPLAVLNIDLDHFKLVNDRFGHPRGDQTLRDIADILKGHIRNYDLAARYAGDEFVVVLARAGQSDAEIVVQKLRAAVERYRQRLAAREPKFPPLGISIGIAIYPQDGTDIQGLLCRSDAAMYTDKRGHRPSVAAADGRRVA